MSYTPELVSPYHSMLQYTKIQILPHMMNSDIENNMEIVLQKKVEKKCNRYGFIDTIHQIESYEENIMTPENLSGAASYNISYHCRICIPIENTIIVGTVKAVNPELIIVSNGPIIIFIPKTNIDSNMWNISNEFTHKKNKTILKVNDYVKILIEKIKINQNDIQIKSIGKLIEYATEDEITKYYGVVVSKDITNIQPTETNFIL
jgi:DNA-directed RNA polymerase subunit E'/Rpb7